MPASHERREHVAHPVEGLVDDSVVVRVERRSLLDVGQTTDVLDAVQELRVPHAFKPRAVPVLAPLAQKLELLRPARAHQLDRQPGREIQRPQSALRLFNQPDQKPQRPPALRRPAQILQPRQLREPPQALAPRPAPSSLNPRDPSIPPREPRPAKINPVNSPKPHNPLLATIHFKPQGSLFKLVALRFKP